MILDRTILVTGASKGIGRAIALRLARDGFRIVVHYHSDEAGGQAALEDVRHAGSIGRLIRFDISDRDGCRTALEADMAAHGTYYGVVLNAGITRDNAFPAMEDAEWDDVLGTNLDGFYNVLRPVVMPMVSARKGGRIVTLSSVSGITGNRGQVNYSAAKAGIIGATKALALELAANRIRVNALAPGYIDTEINHDFWSTPGGEKLTKRIPQRRVGAESDLDGAILLLASSASRYMTGSVITVDGGFLLT